MSEFAVIIDLDKTVVPTWKFMFDVTQTLEVGFGIDREQFYGQVDGLHIIGHNNLRHYDFFEHVRGLGLDSDEVESYILQAFEGRNYVYDDVPQFLDFLLSEVNPDLALLLTYGEQRFQHLKYKCAPVLGGLACIDTLEPKGHYIEKHFAGSHGVVIDDKPIDALPANFRGVLLERDVRSPSGGQSYNSLYQVRQQWSEITSEFLGDNGAPP